MRCPLDDAQLREVTRQGVQIDICPECKGVWLERGELEKLMEASEQAEVEYERSRSRGRDDYDDDRRRGGGFFGSSGDSFGDSGDRTRRGGFFGSSGDRGRGYTDERGRPVKKKKSWFSQMIESVGGEGED
jgi:Zn-finger nucleic acid-binding protein